jgi:hypothetical protein
MAAFGAYGDILAGALVIGAIGLIVSIIEQKRRWPQ